MVFVINYCLKINLKTQFNLKRLGIAWYYNNLYNFAGKVIVINKLPRVKVCIKIRIEAFGAFSLWNGFLMEKHNCYAPNQT